MTEVSSGVVLFSLSWKVRAITTIPPDPSVPRHA